MSEKPKETLGLEVLAAAGPESIVASGGAVASTVQVRETADDVLP